MGPLVASVKYLQVANHSQAEVVRPKSLSIPGKLASLNCVEPEMTKRRGPGGLAA
jgi:hypothetical protein